MNGWWVLSELPFELGSLAAFPVEAMVSCRAAEDRILWYGAVTQRFSWS